MATVERSPDGPAALQPPEALRTLIGRFEPAVIDVPGGRATIRLRSTDADDWDVRIVMPSAELVPADADSDADAVLSADTATWARIADDVRGGMDAYRAGRLRVRHNLHLGVGLLAATAGETRPERLRFERVETANHELSVVRAGTGEPLLCLHGLGATKVSFVPTVSALAGAPGEGGHEVIVPDLPGFGDSHKPATAPYDARWFAQAAFELLDELGIERTHLAGNSMGGRIAIEMALQSPERIGGLALISPSLAWLRQRRWTWLLKAPLPRLGAIQPAPRAIVEPIVRRLVPGADRGWSAAGVDEFLRAYLTPAGRIAFYQSARNIYMDEPYGEEGFWTRLRSLAADSLFVWGRQDVLVPISFMRHVEEAVPDARHLELECGHVPQLERPRETHEAIAAFLASKPL